MKQKKLIRKISLIVMLCVIMTVLPTYKVLASSSDYKVTLWTTDANFTNGLGAPAGPGTTYLTEMKKFYEDQDADTNLINGGHLASNSLDGTNLLWVFLPNVNFNADDITYMGDFLATGGRIVFCGEHPGFFLQGDGYISQAVASLGGNFTILPQMHSPTSGVITGSRLSTGSSLTDGVTGFYFAAAAKISYSGRAKVVLKALDDLPLAVDQSVGKGRITLFTDINIWDPIVQSHPSSGTIGSNNGALFANLMKDAKENQDIVSAGGDPNEDTVAKPTADPMSGNIISGSTVTLSTVTTGAAIHFTTDLQEPNAGSTTGSAVTITGTVGSQVTVKAIATKTGMSNSEVATFTYTISGEDEQPTTGAAATYTLNYTAGTGGTIRGQSSQIVDSGEDGSVVTAVADSNYYFVRWSDGKINASRKDTNVEANVRVSAIFRANSSSRSSSSSSTEQITANVTDGNSNNSIVQTIIERVTTSDGNKHDTVNYTVSKAQETIGKLLKEGKDVARIVIPDTKNEVSETTVNIPKNTLSVLSNGNVSLEIDTENARISLPKQTVQDLYTNGQDIENLYFRLVPIKDAAKQQEIQANANKEAVMKVVSGSNSVQAMGKPIAIETNMNGREVNLTIPLKDISIPIDPAQRQTFLNDLGIYIEHSDGTKEFVKGEVVEYETGVYGIKFTVTKFSNFTIVKLNQPISGLGTWQNTLEGWRYIENGAAVTGWKQVNGSWYLMNSAGIMETGWKQVDGSWYFLKADGAMATGWQEVNGKWYYLYSNGSMASSTVIDGYTVDENGAWV